MNNTRTKLFLFVFFFKKEIQMFVIFFSFEGLK